MIKHQFNPKTLAPLFNAYHDRKTLNKKVNASKINANCLTYPLALIPVLVLTLTINLALTINLTLALNPKP